MGLSKQQLAAIHAKYKNVKAYDVKAKKMVKIENSKVRITKNGRLQIAGISPATGIKVGRFIKG